MADIAKLDQILAPVAAWARSRSDVFGLAIVGSWARGSARSDSDIDLMVLVPKPQAFRCDDLWLAEIQWGEARVTGWHDADYGMVWSRHVRLEPPCEMEFTFCALSWTATDPVDPGSLNVVSTGCRILVDKLGLFESLLAEASP
jgi:hypothetical protein